MKVKLTKKFIDSVDYTAKGTEIYMDDVLTGFALRVGKQSKRYTLHKRINGKLYRDEVEETHLITLTEAREKASIMMANIKKVCMFMTGFMRSWKSRKIRPIMYQH